MPFALRPTLWFLVPSIVVLVIAWRSVMAGAARRRSQRLLRLDDRRSAATLREPLERDTGDASSWLERWLEVSGFRGAGVVQRFILLQGAATIAGLVATLLVLQSGIVETWKVWLDEVPGGPGILLMPVLSLAPWVIFVIVASLPILRVRARRHEIVAAVDRDLPMALALLATLAESGLGLDAAIERVLRALEPGRPLSLELRQFRAEIQAGIPRLMCFRRFEQRLDMLSVSIFVSAILHAEDIGGGIAESLRRQADEVWGRRREHALQKAQSLPTKLAIPLVFCFLPGIFVYTFGPALAQFLEIAEGVVRGVR